MSNLRRCATSAAIIATITMLAAVPSPVGAQCLFDRPTASAVAKTGTFNATLVQAFVNCDGPGGNTPNTITQGGLPACIPTETWNQQAGFPANGWRFSQVPGQSWGRVRLDRISGAFTSPPGTREMRIRLWLRKIVDASGLVNGSGRLQLLLRVTDNDPVSGDITVIDFPVQAAVTLSAGNVTLTTQLGTLLGLIAQPRFPDCSSIEIVSIAVLDTNLTVFAVPGVRIIP